MHRCVKCGNSIYDESFVSRADGKSEICRECFQEETVEIHEMLRGGTSMRNIQHKLRKELERV